MAHLFGLVATPHVLSDVLDALNGLFDFRWDHRKCHHRVDTLWTQLTCYFPHVWCFWGLLPILAGARAFLPSAALHRWELTVPELQTVEGASSHLLEITTRVQIKVCICFNSKSTFSRHNFIKNRGLWDISVGATLSRLYRENTCFFPVIREVKLLVVVEVLTLSSPCWS